MEMFAHVHLMGQLYEISQFLFSLYSVVTSLSEYLENEMTTKTSYFQLHMRLCSTQSPAVLR